MSEGPHAGRIPELPRGRRWRIILGATLRVLITIAVLVTLYYVVPTTRSTDNETDLFWLLLGLVGFAAAVVVQVPAILRAKYPTVRGIQSIALIIPLFLLFFARIYLSNSLVNQAAFSEPLDHTSALYFTITVFVTVGFGDITPESGAMQILVSLQMLSNLVVLGGVVKVLTDATRRARLRRGDSGGDRTP